MATSQFSSPVDSDTDVDFRAWGSQISAQLAAVGLTQTADTGQIDWTTVTVASPAGFEIWRFNDSLQSTTPIFMKIEYGANSAESPQMWVTVGPSSDGAGTITGTLKSNRIPMMTGGATFGNTYPSYICYNAAQGFLGVALKLGIDTINGGGGLLISRTNDTSGAPTADGWSAYVGANGGSNSLYYFQNPGLNMQLPTGGNFAAAGGMGAWPLNRTTSFAGGANQVIPVTQFQPAFQFNNKLCVGLITEIPIGNQFSLNIVGLTAHNYVSVGNAFSCVPIPTANNTYTACMLWE